MGMHLKRMKENKAYTYLEGVKEVVRDLRADFDMERFYVDVYKHKLYAYLPNKPYYERVLNKFKSKVESVRGPWTDEHVDMLIDYDTSIAVRKTNYWKKYNIKVNARPDYGVPWQVRKDKIAELRQFFKDNSKPEEIRFQRTRWGECSFWTSDLELTKLEPFLQLAHPGTRLHVTRCFLIK